MHQVLGYIDTNGECKAAQILLSTYIIDKEKGWPLVETAKIATHRQESEVNIQSIFKQQTTIPMTASAAFDIWRSRIERRIISVGRAGSSKSGNSTRS